MLAFQAMRHWVMMGLLHGLLLLSLAGRVAAQVTPSQKPLVSEWRLVAHASHIFHGKLAPAASVDVYVRGDQYFAWRLEKVTALKGPLPPSANALFYTTRSSASKLAERVTALQGTEVVIFATKRDDSFAFLTRTKDYPPKPLYLAFHEEPEAIQPMSAELLASLREELKNQERIAAVFPRSAAAKPDRYHAQVKRWIGGLFKEATAQPAIDELSKLGVKAVPSLIRLMDDRRPLAKRMLGFPNPPRPLGAPPTGSAADFESHFHFSADLAVDAIANLLKMITDEEVDFLRAGSTEEQRKAMVRAWRIYLYYTYADTGYANKNESPMTTVNPVY
jgi:hypothetical protein